MMANDLLLVGSIPLETVEEVFTEFGGRLGPHLASLPDGEVGPRSHWISRVHYQVLANHSQLDVVQTPALVDGVERLRERLVQLHPYEVPEVVVLSVDADSSHRPYVDWVRAASHTRLRTG